MKDWFNHFLAGSGAEIYDRLQALRTDYSAALLAMQRRARIIAGDRSRPCRVLDVACGTAIATRTAFKYWRRDRFLATGLDFDAGLLRAARRLLPGLRIKQANMVRARLREKFDLVICSFAYHHAADRHKSRFCANLRSWVKDDGDVLVLEICLHSREVQPYYTALMAQMRRGPDYALGRKFLSWTMQNDRRATGEWKVPFRRMERDFLAAGFVIQHTERIWTAPGLSADSGCYLVHLKPRHGPV